MYASYIIGQRFSLRCQNLNILYLNFQLGDKRITYQIFSEDAARITEVNDRMDNILEPQKVISN